MNKYFKFLKFIEQQYLKIMAQVKLLSLIFSKLW